MIRRLLAPLVGAVVVVGASAPAALAHDSLVSTNPPDGAQLEVVPGQIEMVFTATPLGVGTAVQVTGPDGALVSVGDPQIVDTTVTQPLAPDAPAGAYHVLWRVTSSDGHPISGEYTFDATVGAAAPTAPSEPAPDATSNQAGAEPAPTGSTQATTGADGADASSARWPAVAGAVAAVAVLGAVVVVLGRLRAPSS